MKKSTHEIVMANWEEIHPSRVGQFPDSQMFDGKWYIGKWGCDTLQHMVDMIKENEKVGMENLDGY